MRPCDLCRRLAGDPGHRVFGESTCEIAAKHQLLRSQELLWGGRLRDGELGGVNVEYFGAARSVSVNAVRSPTSLGGGAGLEDEGAAKGRGETAGKPRGPLLEHGEGNWRCSV